jgi:hypothetical protein
MKDSREDFRCCRQVIRSSSVYGSAGFETSSVAVGSIGPHSSTGQHQATHLAVPVSPPIGTARFHLDDLSLDGKSTYYGATSLLGVTPKELVWYLVESAN